MQRHESRPLVSDAETNSVIQGDPSLHRQSSAVHSNRVQSARPQMQAWEGFFSLLWFKATRSHIRPWRRWLHWCVQHKPSVLCRDTLGTLGSSTSAELAESQRAESPSEQPLNQTLCPHRRREGAHPLMPSCTAAPVLTAQRSRASVCMWECDRGRVEGSWSRGQPVKHKSPSAARANYILPLLN